MQTCSLQYLDKNNKGLRKRRVPEDRTMSETSKAPKGEEENLLQKRHS